MGILEINRSLIALDAEYAGKEKEFNDYKKSYQTRREALLDQINLVKHSIDTEKFEHGRELLLLEFPSSTERYSGKRIYHQIYSQLISDAKKDLATGAKKLSSEYIGQKYYEGFDQRCDCKYGYGPSHGNVYQSIGLKSPNTPLTDYDAECCLYLLENIDVVLENLNK